VNAAQGHLADGGRDAPGRMLGVVAVGKVQRKWSRRMDQLAMRSGLIPWRDRWWPRFLVRRDRSVGPIGGQMLSETTIRSCPCARKQRNRWAQPITQVQPCNARYPQVGGQSYLSHPGLCGEAGEVA